MDVVETMIRKWTGHPPIDSKGIPSYTDFIVPGYASQNVANPGHPAKALSLDSALKRLVHGTPGLLIR
jgi:hypothetical protein